MSLKEFKTQLKEKRKIKRKEKRDPTITRKKEVTAFDKTRFLNFLAKSPQLPDDLEALDPDSTSNAKFNNNYL
jgi:hypothetical protein